MAELEIHHEIDSHDPLGQKVGVMAAVIAVLLAIVTIMSHRTHTDAIMLRSEVNDKWSYYQAKKIKMQNMELRFAMVSLIAQQNEATKGALEKTTSEIERYNKESEKIMEEARELEAGSHHAEHKALRFDIGEGLLEIGLVLSSLYFIARKKLFPVVGVIAGAIGVLVGASGFFV